MMDNVHRKRHCKHCGWSKTMHEEVEKDPSDKHWSEKDHFEYSFNGCPYFEVDLKEVW